MTHSTTAQQSVSTQSHAKSPWEAPRISLLEASCTDGAAKAATGNEATANGPS